MSFTAQQIIDCVAPRSRVLGAMLARHPEWAQVLAEENLSDEPDLTRLQHECDRWCGAAVGVAQGLRQFKYFSLLRLAVATWLAQLPTEIFLREWSRVADIILRRCCTEVFDIAPDDANAPLTLITLGKLGAGELNLSSDVDLLLVRNDALPAEHITPTQLFDFSQLLEVRTADGFLFRLDWDLRPEGRSGVLVPCVSAALAYYESRGALWERMMLLRARALQPASHVAQQFLRGIRPFVFRRHTSFDILSNLRELKEGFTDTHERAENNIKFGSGGIREVEFIVHALQLLHGGHIVALQTPSTWTALQVLITQRLLPTSHGTALQKGYGFLRHVENMLQIEGEQQTHTLPDTAWDALATRTHGTPEAAPKLRTALTRHRRTIHEAFNLLFCQAPEKLQLTEQIESNLRTCHTLEEQLDGLSWNKRGAVQQLLAQEQDGHLPYPRACHQLTLIADVIVENIVRIAEALMPRQPPCAWCLVAMGSFGAFEMDYGSDLDLLFLYDGDGAEEYFSRLAQKILAMLTPRYRYGRLYPVDADLRPSGRFGTLVSSLAAFTRYHNTEAQLWERQALLRARAMAGPARFVARVQQLLTRVAFTTTPATEIVASLLNLRQRMETERGRSLAGEIDVKFGPGGTADVETLVQCLQLQHGTAQPTLQVGNTWQALAACQRTGCIANRDAVLLTQAYTRQRRLLAHSRLISNSRTTRLNCDSASTHALMATLREGTVPELIALRATTRDIFTRQMRASIHM